MMQLYFLSVVTVILSGVILASDMLAAKFSSLNLLRNILMKPPFRFTAAGLTAVVSLFTLLYMSPDRVPILGDLLPSLMGLFMAFTIGYEYYVKHSAVEETIDDPDLHPLVRYKGLIGFGGILSGVLHFIIPQAIIL